jgi:hypothetical protein
MKNIKENKVKNLTHDERIKSLELSYLAKSSLANPKMFARISKKNMPFPIGKVYKD